MLRPAASRLGEWRRHTSLRVLTYHRVADPAASALFDPRLVSTTPAQFARQMEYVARTRRVVTLGDAVRAVVERAPLPPKATLITFDDGYFDLAHHAFPTLSRLGLPAVVFVPTAFPDEPWRSFWWDRLYRALRRSRRTEVRCPGLPTVPLGPPAGRSEAIRRVHDHLKMLAPARLQAVLEELEREHESSPLLAHSVLSWEELRVWEGRGIAVASHSRTHPILTSLSLAEAAAEIDGAQRDIERHVGVAPPVFCYPNGSVEMRLVALLRDMGFALAFTTRSGGNDFGRCEPLLLRRQSIYRRSVLPIFGFRLTRAGAALDAWRDRRARQGDARVAPARRSPSFFTKPTRASASARGLTESGYDDGLR